jgi:hypothetical protein
MPLKILTVLRIAMTQGRRYLKESLGSTESISLERGEYADTKGSHINGVEGSWG